MLSIDETQTVGAWLKDLHSDLIERESYSYLPLAEIQRCGSWGQQGLFDSLLIFANYPMDDSLGSKATQAGLDGEFISSFEETNYAITVSATLTNILDIAVEYNTQQYNDCDIQQVVAHFKQLLLSLTASQHKQLGLIELLSPSEASYLVDELNPDVVSVDLPLLHQEFEVQAKQNPDNTALWFAGEEITYEALNNRANQLAHFLRAQGVQSDSFVALCIERSIDLIVAILGVLKAGGAYIPVDVTYPESRIAYILDDANAEIILTQQDLISELPADDQMLLALDDEMIEGLLDQYPQSNLNSSEQSTSDVAYVVYTSGSTGQPKGVMVEHHSIANLALSLSETYRIEQTARLLQAHSPAFDVAQADIFMTLSRGATLVLCPQEKQNMLTHINKLLDSQRITHFAISPTFLSLIKVPKTTSLQAVISGGEISNDTVLNYWQERCAYFFAYGPTEATVCSHTIEFKAGMLPNSIGRAIDNVETYIVSKHNKLMPYGAVGELLIGGTGVARGYLNQEELTAQKFIANPFKLGKSCRLYRTGDLVRYLPCGGLEFIGRVDEQVKIRGYRVELGEVEQQLVNNELVSAAYVTVQEQEGAKRLVAYLIPNSTDMEKKYFINSVRKSLEEKLPDYMIPSAWLALEKFPLTANGKIDKKQLPEPNMAELQGDFIAPSNDVEQILVDIWAALLKIDAQALSVQSSFFELGGDSILSIQMVSRAAKRGLHFTVKDIFDAQNISSLALLAKSGVIVEAPQSDIEGKMPLLPIHEYFFEDEVDVNHYNQAVLLSIPSTLEQSVIEQVVTQLYRRHDALRLCFSKEADGWQAEFREYGYDLVEGAIEYKQLPDDSYSKLNLVADEVHRSLSIADANLFKVVRISHTGAELDRLLIVMHHLITDGVSWRIILEDIEKLFTQWQTNTDLQLGEKTSSYQQWAQHLQAYAQSESLQLEKNYWLERGSLPTVCFREYAQTESQKEVKKTSISWQLNSELTNQLLQDCPGVYRTQVNELLLASLFVAMNRWCGESTLRVELEGHGREALFESIDLSQTVGWFTTNYPVTLFLPDGSLDIEAFICASKEQYRTIPNKGIGFGVLKYMAKDPIVSNLELPELVFNYLGQFDQVVNENNSFSVAQESSGQAASTDRVNRYPLVLNGMVAQDKLKFTLAFDENLYSADRMNLLMQEFEQAVADIVSHCLNTSNGRYTPSDFELADVEQRELDAWTCDDIVDLYPATEMQQGLLYHSLLTPGNYVIQAIFEFKNVHLPHFKAAWEHVIGAHEIFRTSFVGSDVNNTHQRVHEKVRLPWTEVDLSELSASEQLSKIEQYRSEDKLQGFDITQAPLMRVTVFKLDEHTFQLLWTHHHALLDGWCGPIIFGDVTKCYQAFMQNQPASLPQRMPYRNYIGWLQQQDMSDSKTYWHEALSKLGKVTPMPMMVGQSIPLAKDMDDIHLDLSVAQTEQLQHLANECKTTVNVILQACWGLLLAKYSGETTVAFGTVTSGRPAELDGIEEMVGLFINTIPTVVDVDLDLSVAQWLNGLYADLVTREAHSYLPLAEIQRCAPVGQRGLFDSVIIFANYPTGEGISEQVSEQGLTGEFVSTHEGTNYDLTVGASLGKKLNVKLQYNRNQYSQVQIDQIAGHLFGLLTSIGENSERSVNELSILNEDDIKRLTCEMNKRINREQVIPLASSFESQVAQQSDKLAVWSAEESLTYNQLNTKANKIAHLLLSQGVEKDSLVALCIERSVDLVAAIVGVNKAGCAYVPVDMQLPEQRINFILEDTCADIILTQEALFSELPIDSQMVVPLDGQMANTLLDGFGSDNPARDEKAHLSSLAYIIYTSGSTGTPKGVMVENVGVANAVQALALEYKIDHSSNVLQFVSPAFDVAQADIWMALTSGAGLYLVGNDKLAAIENVNSVLSEQNITHLSLAASSLSMVKPDSATNLEALIVGGESSNEHMLSLWSKHCRYYLAYGPTETSICSHTKQYLPGVSNKEIGSSIPNVSSYIVSPSLDLMPIGAVGELVIGGIGVSRGYLNQQALTNASFIENTFDEYSGEKLYRTGDLVKYLDNGSIEFIGRIDEQVKIRGHRIELGEIERHLSELDFLMASAVIAKKDESGDSRLIAYISAASSDESNISLIEKSKEYLAKKLPEYCVPSIFTVVDRLPLTINGKVDKKSLPEPDLAQLQGEFVPLSTEMEVTVGKIWGRVLNRDSDSISAVSSFFELGGDSLLAVRLVTEIEAELNVKLDIKDLFSLLTIKKVSEFIAVTSVDVDVDSDVEEEVFIV
ncbi:non-ribosomal peptide synthetase [Pseudoalteromonas umbrosa]|uniref:non-ribosomal peptide synthetase n=1 Tax=Pseudoalteromonas umbrosa TaxID=3048489 RepID=UPI0024C448D8|nr:non-ribosomal peptide synthetase [Pseudoalteromonas sp. B95]MDK1290423.1 amino acid adenylation domain-containing protein [Pseudoalteromonas sp. B95]